MNRAECVRSGAAVIFMFVAVVAMAQEGALEIFREEPQVAPAAESPMAERSVLAGGMAGNAEPAADICQCVVETNSPTVARIAQAMASPLRGSGLDFNEAPLRQVVHVIEDEYGFPVRLDVAALDEIGINADEPVTFRMNGISLRSALRLMLQQIQLTYIIQDEVLLITTPEAAEQELRICVYDVREIVGVTKNKAPDVDELIDTIVSCVATETWAENGGGEAEIRWIKPGFLVISQTQAVHDEVRALLATIRDVRKRPTNSSGANADSAAAAEADANRVTTRFYSLKLGESSNSEAISERIHALIIESLPDERWKGKLGDGQAVVLGILPDRVVLRHKPSVHEEVETLLADSGLLASRDTRGITGGGRYNLGGLADSKGGGFFQPQAVTAD